jgi:hypothetical protein
MLQLATRAATLVHSPHGITSRPVVEPLNGRTMECIFLAGYGYGTEAVCDNANNPPTVTKQGDDTMGEEIQSVGPLFCDCFSRITWGRRGDPCTNGIQSQ